VFRENLLSQVATLDQRADSSSLDDEGWALRYHLEDQLIQLVKEICPRGNNNIVIIIFLVHDNVYIPC
jgi:hypothetical protein